MEKPAEAANLLDAQAYEKVVESQEH
jgi:hypothetical protein